MKVHFFDIKEVHNTIFFATNLVKAFRLPHTPKSRPFYHGRYCFEKIVFSKHKYFRVGGHDLMGVL